MDDSLPEITFGFQISTLLESDIKNTKAAMDVWIQDGLGNAGFKISSKIYDDLHSIINDLKNDKLDIANIAPHNYLRISRETGVELAYGSVFGGNKFRKYLIITHADSLNNDIKDLKGKTLAIMRENQGGLLYLNTILLRNNQQETNSFFSSVIEKQKFSQAIFAVFFGQANACVAPEMAFNTMVELNPQLGKRLKVLSSSPPIVHFVALFRKSLPDNIKQALLNEVLNMENTEYGRQVLMLFHIDRCILLEKSDLASVNALLTEYEKLKNL